jgi:hypothetical protein
MGKTSKEILEYTKTIAVVGASRDPSKPSASVPMTLKRHGFRIIPVERGFEKCGDSDHEDCGAPPSRRSPATSVVSSCPAGLELSYGER